MPSQPSVGVLQGDFFFLTHFLFCHPKPCAHHLQLCVKHKQLTNKHALSLPPLDYLNPASSSIPAYIIFIASLSVQILSLMQRACAQDCTQKPSCMNKRTGKEHSSTFWPLLVSHTHTQTHTHTYAHPQVHTSAHTKTHEVCECVSGPNHMFKCMPCSL